MRINLNMDDLHAFAEVARKLNYKSAADSLNISPSALSRRIQKLEESLNVQLFVRTTRDVKLTPAGKELYRSAQDILANVEEMLFAMRGEGNRHSRLIRVGCVPSALRGVLLPALKSVIGRYPSAQVKIVDATAVQMLDALYQQEISFGISYIGKNESGIDFMPLMDDPFIVAVRDDHPFASRSEVSWDDITKERTIAARHGAGLRMLMDLRLAQSRKRINWTYEVQHVNSALSLVNEGLGIAVVPQVCISSANYERVIPIPFDDTNIDRTLGLIRLSNTELPTLAQQLWDALARTWQEHISVPSNEAFRENS